MKTLTIPDNVHHFTRNFWREKLSEFRVNMGDKRWWAEEKRHADVEYLGLIYLYIVNDDGSQPTREQIAGFADQYSATIGEYQRREFYHVFKVVS